MNKQHLVFQRVWARVLNTPDAPALLLRNTNSEPPVVVVPSPFNPALAILAAPEVDSLDAGGLGTATAAVMALLRKNGFTKGDRAAIMAWNCPEWVIADLAIQSLGGITVPIYPHSAPDQVNYVIRDSGAKFLLSSEPEQLTKLDPSTGCQTVLFDNLAEQLTGVRTAVRRAFVDHFVSDEVLHAHAALWCAVNAELRNLRDALELDPWLGVSPDDICTIIYTSGSTGVPKGVVLTHRAFAAECEGLLAHGFAINAEDDVYLSYLPLAHVYERAAGMMLCMWTGVPMAFCRVEDVGATLKKVQPTLIHGVPAVWRKVKEKIDMNLMAATGLKAMLIRWAFQQTKPGVKRWLADVLVFGKIRKELGGKIRICTSGGAPISTEIITFYRTIGIELLQGYGLTETTGASTVNRPNGKVAGKATNKTGSVGPLVDKSGLKMRIVPLPGQESSGEGEIQFNGPTVMKGYWGKPAETAATFTEDGWFKTGDLGRVDSDGFLYITGRIKRMLKTDGGKYVAPEKIEKAFEAEPIVQYIVPVGDGKPFISGLIFVNQLVAHDLLTKLGASMPPGTDRAVQLATHPLIKEAVEKAVAGANAKLERWETLKKWQIVEVEASVANGLLTPTLKIRAEEASKRFATIADSFYEKKPVK